jgi:uncharacterized membrane protein YfcA
MEQSAIIYAVAGLIAAGIIKGATGIGYSSCALPFLVATVGLKPALALLVVPAMASNIMVVFSAGHLRTTVRDFWPLYVATLPGIVLGICALSALDQQLATKLLGGLIVTYGVQSLLQPSFQLGSAFARSLRVPVGLLSGFFTGLTGSQVMPLMPYMLSLDLSSQQLVQAVNLAVITASLFLGVCLMAFRIVQADVLALSILAVVPALIGVQAGALCRAHIGDRQFRALVVIVLTAIGAALIIR